MALATITALAAAFRLWRLDLTVFAIDEAALVRLAEDLVRLGHVPLSGPMTSVGIPSAPHFIYAIAPIVGPSRDPALVAGAIAVANLAAVVGALWLGWRWYGTRAALIVALLFATCTWAVFAARHIWQPDLLPPFAVLLLVALDLGVVERRAWWAAASLPIAAFGTLVHPAFALIAPFAISSVVALLVWRRIGPLAVAVVISALIIAPFAVHEVQTHWADIANYRYYSSLNTFVDLDSVQYGLVLAGGFGAPNDADVPRLDTVLPQWLVTSTAVLEIALLAIGLVVVVSVLARWRGISREVRLRNTALVLWVALPIVLTIRHSFPVQAHYLLEIYPAPFLFIGAAFWWSAIHVAVQRILLAAVIAIAGVQGFGVIRLIQNLPSMDPACYGPSLQAASAVAQSVLDLTSEAHSQHAAVELDAGDALSTAYLVRGGVAEVDMVGVGTFGLHEHGSDPTTPISTTPDALAGRGPHDLRYDNGVQLLGVAYATQPEPDQRVHLAIMWNVGDSAPPNRPLVWDVSLHDIADRVPYDQSGIDHVPVSIADETIVSWFSVQPPEAPEPALPPGPYTVHVQLVDAFNSAPVAFTDSHGSSASEWTIGPVLIAPRATCT